jgi:hypothetical protein
MEYRTWAICIFILFFVFVVYRGNRAVKAKDNLDKQMEDTYGPILELADNVIYQGGFPPMPKPARLNLGVTESGLILFDKAGNHGRIGYDKIKKQEKFTTTKTRKVRFGLMAYGPLALVLNRPTVRHFYVVEYTDVDNDENNMVVMVKNKEVAERLYASVKPHIKRGGKGK